MSAVVRLCPSVCESSHFAVLLGAYGATLSVLGEGLRNGEGRRLVGHISLCVESTWLPKVTLI
jgi:hypothetical protein